MKCRKGYEVQILHSAAGWYRGTLDEYGMPNCRLSSTYSPRVEGADKLPLDRQDAMENIYCNGCGNCKIK